MAPTAAPARWAQEYGPGSALFQVSPPGRSLPSARRVGAQRALVVPPAGCASRELCGEREAAAARSQAKQVATVRGKAAPSAVSKATPSRAQAGELQEQQTPQQGRVSQPFGGRQSSLEGSAPRTGTRLRLLLRWFVSLCSAEPTLQSGPVPGRARPAGTSPLPSEPGARESARPHLATDPGPSGPSERAARAGAHCGHSARGGRPPNGVRKLCTHSHATTTTHTGRTRPKPSCAAAKHHVHGATREHLGRRDA